MDEHQKYRKTNNVPNNIMKIQKEYGFAITALMCISLMDNNL